MFSGLMGITLLKSKVHRAVVTGASVDYEGSLTIDVELMKMVGLLPFEKILVSNICNGGRLETYAIPGEPGKRQIELNGAAAFLGKIGDRVTIMAFATLTPEEAASHTPRTVLLGESNQVLDRRPAP